MLVFKSLGNANMLNLITIAGKNAGDFYLKKQFISDFQSLMRTVTSGRTLIVSTSFRTDLFYKADQPKDDDILKLWRIYSKSKTTNLDYKDIMAIHGEEESLTKYFLSINVLSSNSYKYRVYRETFQHIFSNDQNNPISETVAQCDQYLIEHTNIKRIPLVDVGKKTTSVITNDTLALAMKLIKNRVLSN